MAVNRGAIYKSNLANKSAAAALKSKLLDQNRDSDAVGVSVMRDDASINVNGSEKQTAIKQSLSSALGKRKADLMENESSTPGRNTPQPVGTPKPDKDEPAPDDVRLWEEGYADRYYEQKFQANPKDIAFRNKVAQAYVEGLAWVLLYYFQGCPSWTWYYPYHYAPFAADFIELDRMRIRFEEGKPFKPYEQLMSVLPAASNHAIPKVFRSLMSDEDSDILDFYPEEFPIDLNGKKFAWQGVALLPFIDPDRLLKAMATRYPLLSAEDVARNELGKDTLIFSDQHPLYVEVASNFYSKRQGIPRYKLDPRISEGLAGRVEKNVDYIPQSPLVSPIEDRSTPHLDEDHSIRYASLIISIIRHSILTENSVHYAMPKSHHVHKSMLLRGVKESPRILTSADIEVIKGRARNSGRSYGGAPFRGGSNGRNRGRGPGNNDHAVDPRPNPFAAHIMPGYNLPLSRGGWGPPAPGNLAYHQDLQSFQGGSSTRYPPRPNDGYRQPPNDSNRYRADR
jgi:5'-3' exoribonuclease 2